MKHFSFLLLGTFLLTGCGGGSSSSSDGGSTSPTPTPPSQPSGQVEMVLSQPYTVHPGDFISKTSDNALVAVSHTEGHEESVVTLMEGSATITYK
jgi:hypothetical protein